MTKQSAAVESEQVEAALKHDFRSHESLDSGLSRWMVADRIATGRQIIYHVSDAERGTPTGIAWSREADDGSKRRDLGVHLALVHVVAGVDLVLSQACRGLWQRRRDLLEPWVVDHFTPRVGSLASAAEAMPLSDQRRESREQSTVHLPLAFSDVWAPSTRHQTLEDYVRDTVFQQWDRLSPNDKIRVLRRRVFREGEGLSEDLYDSFHAGLSQRNEYVHPRPHDSPPISRHAAVQPSKARPLLDARFFERFCVGALGVIDWLDNAMKAATGKWVATNIKGFRGGPSDLQRLALGGYWRGSSESYESLDGLLTVVEEAVAKGTAPSLLLLKLDDEIVNALARLDAFQAQHPSLPLIYVHDCIHLNGDAHKRWQAHLNSKLGPAPKKAPKESRPFGLQRLPTFTVVYDRPLVFDDAGRNVLTTDKIGRQVWKMHRPDHVSFDYDEPLQVAIAEATGVGRRFGQ